MNVESEVLFDEQTQLPITLLKASKDIAVGEELISNYVMDVDSDGHAIGHKITYWDGVRVQLRRLHDEYALEHQQTHRAFDRLNQISRTAITNAANAAALRRALRLRCKRRQLRSNVAAVTTANCIGQSHY